MKKYKIDTESGAFLLLCVLLAAFLAISVMFTMTWLISKVIGVWAIVAVPLILVVVAFLGALRVVEPDNEE